MAKEVIIDGIKYVREDTIKSETEKKKSTMLKTEKMAKNENGEFYYFIGNHETPNIGYFGFMRYKKKNEIILSNARRVVLSWNDLNKAVTDGIDNIDCTVEPYERDVVLLSNAKMAIERKMTVKAKESIDKIPIWNKKTASFTKFYNAS